MKHVHLLLLAAFLCLADMEAKGQTPSLVEGENLNIGSSNILMMLGTRPYGNAIGTENYALSLNTLAVGSNDTVSVYSEGSVSLGSANRIQGAVSMVLGYRVRVLGSHGVGIGRHINVTGLAGSMAIGSGIGDSNGGTVAPLSNSVGNSLAIGFNSSKPTLFVSESPNNIGLNILDRTGRVAIGDVTPQAKLHIRSDEDEDAGVIIVPADPTENGTFIRLHDNNHQITVNNAGLMTISAGNNKEIGITSSNFKVESNTATLGTTGNNSLFLSSGSASCLTSNAKPVNGSYIRISQNPSYALEFNNKALLVLTALYEDPRDDLIANWSNPLSVGTDGTITLNGKVGVNTENDMEDYALAVNGGVITTKVHIQDVTDWNDCVFDEDYPLLSLDEMEAFVAANRHLPGILSEAEVKAEGFDLAEMQAALLGKVEELVLHTIRQQREIDSLRDLVTVRFGYDACGNRISRALEFQRMNEGRGLASLTDTLAGTDLALFPNPTEGGFVLSLADPLSLPDATATLCALDGTVLERRTVTGALEEFDLSGRPAGMYLLHLSSNETVQTWKIIKRN